MKLWTLARCTFGSFLHNRLILVLGLVFVLVILLMMTPLLGLKMMATADNAGQMEAVALNVIAGIMSFVSGVGSLLAAWTAADSVGTEMTSGTIQAVMARPVWRWEFLLGKFTGVMMFMSAYTAMMLFLSYLLALIAGEQIHSAPWVLIVYPLARYAIYAALATALVTLVRPVAVIGAVMLVALGAAMVSSPMYQTHRPGLRQLVRGLYWLLPSTNLLSESRFIELTKASLEKVRWTEHLTAIAYGLDYALVLLLLAMWSFHYRSLKRD
jgi:ABC-type transport system involved in multi-copper enzyme maturation permease subunit